ncbi:MAG: hypothetical protein WC565_04110 [Parcubacteria group bacterium]
MQINNLRVPKSDMTSYAMSTVVNLATPGAPNLVHYVVEDVDDLMVFSLSCTSEEMVLILSQSAAKQAGVASPSSPTAYDCAAASLFANWARKSRTVPANYYVLGVEDVYELLLNSESMQSYISQTLVQNGYEVTGIGHGSPLVQQGLTNFIAPSAETLNCGGTVSPPIPNPNLREPGVEPVGASEGMSAGWIFAGVAATAAAGAGLYYLTKRGRK